MAIPLSYNLRNLVARKTTTVMTALGIALTVAVLLASMALVDGLRTSLEASGHPLQIIVMRKGGTAELNSIILRPQFQDLKVKPGIAKSKNGEPLASLEVVTVIILESPENPAGININLRGLLPVGFEMRPQARLVEGRMFETGKREVVVGAGLAKRYPMARLGGKLRFGRGEWVIVGVVDGGNTSVSSEVFADLNQLASDQDRSDGLSSVLIRATDAAAVQPLIDDLENDRRLNVTAMTEKSYYINQTSASAPIQFLGVAISVIMAVGSCFAAMNTMYAAVSRRSSEIGTLRVLGFSRLGILASFFLESVMLSLIGGLLGVILVLPLNGASAGLGNFVTFSENTFQLNVSPQIMVTGVLFALFMGAAGGLFPAASAARKQILTALREV
ncbi:MAG: ABC transporter permease [Bryobacteraceae bacterium]